MAYSSAKASPPLGRWLDEPAREEPYHGQVESWPVSSPTLSFSALGSWADRETRWLHPDVPSPSLAPSERWVTKRRDIPSVLFCRECAKQFTGNWREGNFARHLRSKHRSDLNVSYSCSVCRKSYARSDALLKHERSKHPGLLRAPPAERRLRPSHSRSSSFETQGPSRVCPPRDLYPDGNLTREPLPVASRAEARPQHLSNHSTSPKGSGQHRLVVQTGLVLLASELENSLVPDISNLLDNNLSRLWEPILLQLRNRGSGLDASFRDALEDIRAVVRKNRTDNSTLFGSQPPSTSAAITSCTYTNERNKSRTSSSKAGSSRAESLPGSNPRQLSRVRGHLDAANHSNCGPYIHVREREEDNCLKTLDCPVYKHHVMQNLRSPCRGGKFSYLSQIRHHLQPDRSTHHGFLRFLKNCGTCKQDFVEEETYIAHESHGCTHSTRRRTEDIKVESWARLYVALYPGTSRVPSPFTGERSWLSLDVSNLLPTYRRIFTPPDFTIAQTPGSFLDDRQSFRDATPSFTPATRSTSQDVRYSSSFASIAPLDPNYSPYSQHNLADYPPQQNINPTPQAGYSPEFRNRTTNQTEYSVAYAIILRDALAFISRLYEEGERSLPPMELKELVDEIEDEVHFQLRPRGRNNIESETPVTTITSTPGAQGHEDRTPVDYLPFYQDQYPLGNDDVPRQMFQRNAGGIPLHPVNYSTSLTSEPSPAPYYRAVNHSTLQVPARLATSPGHDSGYISNWSESLDQRCPSTSSHLLDPLCPDPVFRPEFAPAADAQLFPELQFHPEPPHLCQPRLNFAPNAAQAMSVEDS